MQWRREYLKTRKTTAKVCPASADIMDTNKRTAKANQGEISGCRQSSFFEFITGRDEWAKVVKEGFLKAMGFELSLEE